MIINICAANCPQPNFCNRPCWDPSNTHPTQNNPTFTSPTHVIIHHTGDATVFPPTTDFAQVVRFYWDLHVNTNGWSDIGYNWLIDRNGIIYEGRGDGILGAHFSGQNTGTTGIALIGNFGLEQPSSAALNSLQDLLAWESDDKNISINGSSLHNASGLVLNHISGHRDGGSTVCPGNNLYNLLPSIRTNVSNDPCFNSSTNNSDLVIENMYTVPSNPQVGQSVDLFVEIKNVGTVTANSLSWDYEIDGQFIDDDTHSSLAPNATHIESENNYTFTSAGSYNYCVFIDADVNEVNTANNSFCIQVNVTGTQNNEDIFLTNLSVNPLTISPGNDVTAQVTMNYTGNQNLAALPNFDLEYYLSTDCNLDNNDILLDDDVSSIASDDPDDDESAVLTIPSGTPSGTYFILFYADSDEELSENDENNNIRCIQLTVSGMQGGEDIFLTNSSVSSNTLNEGQYFEASTVMNYNGSQLDSNLPNFKLEYILSADCLVNNNDIYLGDDTSTIGSDDPNDPESIDVQIPVGTPAGQYNLLFYADADNDLVEGNESNNVDCVVITVTNNPPTEDIFLTNLSLSSTTMASGTDITALARINYTGNTLDTYLPAFDLNIYLSSDCIIDTSDVLLEDPSAQIGSDDPFADENETITIPQGTPDGNYLILFYADADDELYESDEFNNVQCIQITVDNTLSNEEIEQNKIVIYPNPTTGILKVESGNQLKSYQLFNLAGQLIMQDDISNSQSQSIDISSVVKGVYLIKLLGQNGAINTFRIIKK